MEIFLYSREFQRKDEKSRLLNRREVLVCTETKQEDLDSTPTKPEVPTHRGYGARHTLTILSFWGYFHMYALRFNLSVAMVAMANHTDTKSNPNVSIGGECPGPSPNNTKATSNKAVEFDWDEATQGIILSSFFYGYMATQIPGGMLSEKFGGKHLFGYGILITAVLTILTPLMTKVGLWALILTRVIEGLAEGVTFPAIAAMQGKWIPEMERTSLTVIPNMGASLGNVVVLPVAGYLCNSDTLGGWPSSFYIFGGAACLWFLFWHFLIFETPSNHPRISPEERKYIESTASLRLKENFPTPWKSLLTSLPLWSILLVAFFLTWGSNILNTSIPTYMNKIQKVDITQDGLLMALPNLLKMVVGISSSWIADFLRSRRYMSTVAVRKMFTALGILPAAVCSPMMSLAGCNQIVVVVLIVVGNGMLGCCESGFTVNLLDIGFNYAGILMGLANFTSNIGGLISPYFVGLVTNNNETMKQWQTIFYVSTGMYTVGLVIFLLFGKGTEQQWNKPQAQVKEANVRVQDTENDDIVSTTDT